MKQETKEQTAAKTKDEHKPIQVEKKATVRVVTMGNAPRDVSASTLGEVLALFRHNDLDVRVNGYSVDEDHRLQEGDIITILPQIRGGRESN